MLSTKTTESCEPMASLKQQVTTYKSKYENSKIDYKAQ